MKLICAIALCATLCVAAPKMEHKTEIGEINGAKFRIDIPENWNGGLGMYCPGYSAAAGNYQEGKLPPGLAVFTEQGYAVAPARDAAGGWGLARAPEDHPALTPGCWTH